MNTRVFECTGGTACPWSVSLIGFSFWIIRVAAVRKHMGLDLCKRREKEISCLMQECYGSSFDSTPLPGCHEKGEHLLAISFVARVKARKEMRRVRPVMWQIFLSHQLENAVLSISGKHRLPPSQQCTSEWPTSDLIHCNDERRVESTTVRPYPFTKSKFFCGNIDSSFLLLYSAGKFLQSCSCRVLAQERL